MRMFLIAWAAVPAVVSFAIQSPRTGGLTSQRVIAPQMGLLDNFRKPKVDEVAVPEPEAPAPKMEMSALDKVLVKFDMKREDECVLEPEGENLMEKIKCAGRAGIISYILWEWAFWIGAGGFACATYYTTTGGWPDLSNSEDQAKVAASAFALVNVARFAVPLRIGLALSTVPWVEDNIVNNFIKKDDDESD